MTTWGRSESSECSDLALLLHLSSCWDSLWAELTDVIWTGPLLWKRAGDRHREEPGEDDGKIPAVSTGWRDSLTQRKAHEAMTTGTVLGSMKPAVSPAS